VIVGASDVEDLKERLAAIEQSHNDLNTVVAVLNNQMGGVIRLLWMILGALVVGIVGAFITAWVKVPTVHYEAQPRPIEAPR
jgi:tetrahydromethanopterin S-methyltransferase subunit G